MCASCEVCVRIVCAREMMVSKSFGIRKMDRTPLCATFSALNPVRVLCTITHLLQQFFHQPWCLAGLGDSFRNVVYLTAGFGCDCIIFHRYISEHSRRINNHQSHHPIPRQSPDSSPPLFLSTLFYSFPFFSVQRSRPSSNRLACAAGLDGRLAQTPPKLRFNWKFYWHISSVSTTKHLFGITDTIAT